jgi:hypothetical protein
MITLVVINVKRYHLAYAPKLCREWSPGRITVMEQHSPRGDRMTQIHSPSPTEHNSFTDRPINGRLLLTVSEAAAALRISRSSIYRLFDAGELAWV